ncbi:heat shock cognate 70 kDa protein-like [Histomonas meleagridis]|uniref:heat shock cognate 70 kDa protein-like n=1 Tax=Histomonas meleagridis TaxID=135588 RepID=UPI00355A3E71|nr:heat shock cognate 70 kDa protein-like [Histomonas meleagridis]KAH0802337.1 heat shock cognate 70 kDa protein-like [Histomonas meleagridis]
MSTYNKNMYLNGNSIQADILLNWHFLVHFLFFSKMEVDDTPVIGIDLGTTYCSVGIFKNKSIDIINDHNGSHSVPSYVTFTNDEIIAGQTAKDQAVFYPKSAVYDSKRMLGLKFDDPVIQNDMKLWPFKVIRGPDNSPMVQVSFKGKEETYSPVDISSYLLKHMKNIASKYLSTNVTNVVITVPAYFDFKQIEATKKAGQKAGLNVLRIISEPTAAAIAYGHQEKYDDQKIILVFDFGGGTLDVSILSVLKDDFEVLANQGDMHLGGQDIDNILLKHFAERFKAKHHIDIFNEPRVVLNLKEYCEKAKITLSKAKRYNLFCPSLINGIDYSDILTDAEFNELNHDLFKKIKKPINAALTEAGIDKSKVDYVIMVGGSSRIPAVVDKIKKMFGAEKVCKNIDPEEAVVRGAAIVAANLSKHDDDDEYPIIIYRPIVSHSLGVENESKYMDIIIKKGTKVPTPLCSPHFYTTQNENQGYVKIKIFMGEDELTANNKFLGFLELHNIKKNKEKPKIKVTFSVDIDGILQVKAEDITAGVSNLVRLEVSKQLGI